MGATSERYAYGGSYRERVQLSVGQHVYLRLIHASDKQLLREGFEKLSPYSRYARFMAAKNGLTEDELRYLTEVDGVDHVAIVAIRRHLAFRDEAIGVARFVRLRDKCDTAEPAVAVVDDYQGKGLGTILLHRLVEAAWERDIRWFNVELLADNRASKRLFAALSPEASFRPTGAGTMVITLPVPEPTTKPCQPQPWKNAPVYKLLSYLARPPGPLRSATSRQAAQSRRRRSGRDANC